MQFLLSVQSTPDPASPPGSRSVPGHDPATPALKRLNSPVSIFDALDESPPRVPPKTIREFRRKWSFGGGHSGGVRRLLRLSEREEPGKACMLTTPSPVRPAQQSKAERAASMLCAAARGRSVRRELALVHATATYLGRDNPSSGGCTRRCGRRVCPSGRRTADVAGGVAPRGLVELNPIDPAATRHQQRRGSGEDSRPA